MNEVQKPSFPEKSKFSFKKVQNSNLLYDGALHLLCLDLYHLKFEN
jgi:hypothetical protein